MKKKMCEHCGKRKATQADNYLNEWQCDNCYSKIGRITNDYQADSINWDSLEEIGRLPHMQSKPVNQSG